MNLKRLLPRLAPILALIGGTFAGMNTAHANLTNPGYGTGTSRYSILNLSGGTATVNASYYETAGGGIPTVSAQYTIGVLARTDVNVASQAGLPANWSGAVVLSADQDVSAVATTNYTGRATQPDASTTISGTEATAYDAFDAGSTVLYAPSLFRLPGTNNTPAIQIARFTIQNTAATNANYTVTFVSRAGAALGTVTGALAAYGSRTFQTAVDTDMPATLVSSGVTAFSARVDSNQPLAGVAEVTTNSPTGAIKTNWSGDYSLLKPTQASTKLYSPSAFRLCSSCATPNTNYSSYVQYSSFQLQNTTGSIATVSAQFINRTPAVVSYTLNFTIPANSGYGINLFNGGNVSLASPMWAALGNKFAGSIVINSNVALNGVGNLDLPGTAYYGSYALVSNSDATATVFAPVFNRQCSLGTLAACGTSNIKNYQQASALQIMNVGPAACNNVSIALLHPNGTTAVTLNTIGGSPINLASGGTVGLNSFNGGSFATSQFDTQLGMNFAGSARVTGAACKLKAIVETRNGDIGFDQYNAINR